MVGTMVFIRLAKVAMIGSLAAYAFIVAYDNVVDYGSNYEFVRHVLSMDTTFPGNALMHRAITNESVWRVAYALIIAMEGLTALLLALGAAMLLGRLRSPAKVFNRSKVWAVAGLTVGFALWFLGFMVIAGEYFAMWQSKEWNGQEAAFRITTVILAVLIFVSLPATATVPIVFATGLDPVMDGLVASLNRPGGNATGVSLFTTELGPKRLALLRELQPKPGTIAFVVDPNNGTTPFQVKEMQTAAQSSLRLALRIKSINCLRLLRNATSSRFSLARHSTFKSSRIEL